jgi:fructoselysine transporter
LNNIQPERQLNLVQTTSIIIGIVIGSGVFLNIPIVSKFAGSPFMSALIWSISGILWIPQILILAEMGVAYPAQGGPYFFLYKAGSPFLAFMYTWTAFLTSDTPTLTIIGLAAASALTFFFPSLVNPLYAKLFAVVLISLITFIQYRSVKFGGNFQIFLTIAKLCPLFLLVIIGLFYLNSGNLTPAGATQHNPGSFFYLITAGISSTIWAYAGFLNILYMAGEVKKPERNLPLSLISSIIFVMVAYGLISICTTAIVPFKNIVDAAGQFINPFAYLPFFGKYAGGFFSIAAFISMVGVLNSSIMTQPRLEYAIAKDELFFKVFGHLHPKYRTPDYSIFIQSFLSICLLLLGNIENLLGYFTLSYVLQNGLVYGAIFFLKKKEDYKPTYKVRFWKTMAVFSILVQLYVAWGTFMAYPTAGLLASLGLILTGLPFYLYFYKSKEKQNRIGNPII